MYISYVNYLMQSLASLNIAIHHLLVIFWYFHFFLIKKINMCIGTK